MRNSVYSTCFSIVYNQMTEYRNLYSASKCMRWRYARLHLHTCLHCVLLHWQGRKCFYSMHECKTYINLKLLLAVDSGSQTTKPNNPNRNMVHFLGPEYQGHQRHQRFLKCNFEGYVDAHIDHTLEVVGNNIFYGSCTRCDKNGLIAPPTKFNRNSPSPRCTKFGRHM